MRHPRYPILPLKRRHEVTPHISQCCLAITTSCDATHCSWCALLRPFRHLTCYGA